MASATAEPRTLDLWSGVGLVVANMIGAGVFVSAGFMAQDMGPGAILFAWLVGTVIALAGTRAYATVSQLVPRSGGEYRYLHDLLHPALGYLAGWATLVLGFSAPVAVDALAAAAFAATLGLPGDPRLNGAVAVVVLTLLHTRGLAASHRTQNVLVVVKAALLGGFVLFGLFGGSHAWPTWTPPNLTPGFPLPAFMGSLFFIAFAFAGWNAAVYAAEEFQTPTRDVPRAMAIGCGLVGGLYLVVNWIFVANLTPERAAVVMTDSSRVTLGHLIMQDLAGPRGGQAMSVFAVIAMLSAISAMTFVGPRVYSAMARDGFLPPSFAGEPGRPPVWSTLLQSALVIFLLFTHGIRQILQNVGAVLVFFNALTALALFKVRFSRPDLARPSTFSLACAGLYVVSAGWMLYFGFRNQPYLIAWVAAVALLGLGAYAIARRRLPNR